MRKTTAALLVLGASLNWLTGSAAARQSLTLGQANTAAASAVEQNYLDPPCSSSDPCVTDSTDSYVTSYVMLPCDQETTFRALCDVLTGWNDGATCWDTLEVVQGYGGQIVNSLFDWTPPDSACAVTASAASVQGHTPSVGRRYVVRCRRDRCRGVRVGWWHRRHGNVRLRRNGGAPS